VSVEQTSADVPFSRGVGEFFMALDAVDKTIRILAHRLSAECINDALAVGMASVPQVPPPRR